MDNKRIILVLIGLPAVILALFVGIFIGEKSAPLAANPATNTSIVSQDQFQAFWKAWQVLDSKYVAAASTTPQDRIYGAIEGLASSYGDPYTVFFPPVESKMFAEDIAGDFEGVGMEIGIKNKQLMVVAPLKDSPAEHAGVKAGDSIISINGTSTDGMSTDQAVKFIRGPKGSTVKIDFLTAGATKPVTKSIVRDVINIPTIDTKSLPGGIYKISLYSFSAQSPDLFRNALRDFVLSGDHKLILDLRGNPGGYLDAAWDMSSYFLPAGKVVVTEDFGKNSPQNIYRSKGYNVFNKNLDMIVLVDNGSASAAEILAGALSEQGVAKLVGVKTFGKGSVQELVPITADTSLKVTIARWLTPDGHNLSHDGLDPDYVVPVTEADAKAGKDAQLEKAEQLLGAENYRARELESQGVRGLGNAERIKENKKMKIILLKDVAKLGKRYETKEVSSGHALNLLIPQGHAIAATPAALKRYETERAKSEDERKLHEDLLVKNIKDLESVTITVSGKANEKGHLFAGLHKEAIAAELFKQTQLQIDPSFIQLEHPIKQVAKHEIEVKGGGKSAKFTLVVEAQ